MKVVFSTYVEVILKEISDFISSVGFLHVCGGDPKDGELEITIAGFSPRMWR